MKPLIFIPSPRDLPVFLESTARIKCDKLWVKYHPEDFAYQRGRGWFLEHKEYTHLMILPDDLLMTQQDFDILCKDAEKYDVMSGWCRNTIRLREDYSGEPETEETADSNISFWLPPDPPISGRYSEYRFMSINTIEKMLNMFRPAGIKPLIPVKYAGFPPTFIHRRVIEKVPFRRIGCCVDSCLALDLAKENISQYCDLRVRTTHLNIHDREIQVEKKPPELIFENA